MEQLIADKTFEKIDYKVIPFEKGEYDNCTFRNCDFYAVDLSGVRFVDCCFVGCELSLVKLLKTIYRDVKFIDCKMLGLRFDDCNEFGLSFSFENCILNHSTFFKLKIKKTIFKNSIMQEVDFAECDLTSAVFEKCDLTRSIFDNTILEKVDFRTSFNYSIDPENNRIKKAKFSISEVIGLLDKYEIEIDKAN